MTMASAGDLAGPAGRLLSRTPGAGCLHFVHSPSEESDAYCAYLTDRKTRVSLLAARPGGDPPSGAAAGRGTVLLEALRRGGTA
jgi:hypothetical protein